MRVHLWRALTLAIACAIACREANAPGTHEDGLSYQLVADAGSALTVDHCGAGACKIALAPHFDLRFQVDWSECTGSPAQAPLGAGTAGVMLWPTTLIDLAIPLADSGWLCKLPPNNATSECIVNASQTARELYAWGPIESGCTFLWRRSPDGIEAVLGAGCGMCQLEQTELSASYAFNMGFDDSCRCPKARFDALAAK